MVSPAGVHRATIGRALGLLEQAGMAQREAGRQWGGISAGPDDLRAVAAQHGTLAARAERRRSNCKAGPSWWALRWCSSNGYGRRAWQASRRQATVNMAERCKAQKTNGQPCPNPARASGFCFAHDPAAGGQRAEARRRGGRHSHTRHSDAPMPPADVRSLDDVRALLGYALAECIMGDNSIPRGRLLVAIAAAYLEVIRTGEFESKLAAIEQALALKAAP